MRARLAGATYSLSEGLTANAGYQASMFRTTPLTRYLRKLCGSLIVWLRIASSVALPAQTCAQPRNTRWSPVRPPKTGAFLPLSEA